MSLVETCSATGCAGRLELGHDYYIPLDPWQLRKEIEAYRWSLLAVFGVFAWEIIVTFPEEWSRWKQIFRREMVPINACVLTARWAAWGGVAAVTMYAFSESPRTSCQATLTLIMFFVALNSIALSLIQHIRVTALHVRNLRARRLVTALVVLNACAWIASIAGFRAGPTNPKVAQPGFPGCSPLPSPRWRSLGWGVSMVVDVVILLLTLAGTGAIQKNIRHATGGKHVINLLQGSAWINFLVTFTGNAACFFTTVFSGNLILSNIPIAISTLFNTIIAARVVFHSISWNEGSDILLVGPHSRRPDDYGPSGLVRGSGSAGADHSIGGGDGGLTNGGLSPRFAAVLEKAGDDSIARRGSEKLSSGFRFSNPRAIFSTSKSGPPNSLEDKEYEDAVFRGRISMRRGSEPASGLTSPKGTPDIEAQPAVARWTPNVFGNSGSGIGPTVLGSPRRIDTPSASNGGAAYELMVPGQPPRIAVARCATGRSLAPAGRGRVSPTGHEGYTGVQVHKEVFRITH
ncbi:hypothetical protein K437DRAFT_258956 [Tilletiaria anomala UBC 951]|uniref:Transmembrane protein n=1 Tax=Tilletiaria anomala (strain ATCC 24038 / CBS 436.72 / UBC 951) TaxID=1037660 RepID=A0A066VH99_TILAU|nr:uncharacterized protein K437DRAFT_258956 [Tilletiaria anomala UBC 951]KDN39683.1 hypothetical protein K437DRAFT_258956 [Tilletiaria anomala UBC 951]